MLANERFTAKAPPDRVANERAKAERYGAEVDDLEARLRDSA
jgi:valyl-tRNA synthetase